MAAAAALASATLPAAAHEFWLEPSAFRVAPGEIVSLRTRVGEYARGDALPRNPAHLERFVVGAGDGLRDVPGHAGVDPAGAFRAGPDGFAVVGYESRPTHVEIPAARFDDYLRAEGLDDALAARAFQGEAGPGREAFSRCAKTVLRVGDGGRAEGFDRRLGLRLEIVPVEDPTRGPTGGSTTGDEEGWTTFLLLHRGEPLTGVRVAAIPAADRQRGSAARTGADGRVRLLLGGPGPWLVKAVHMTPAPPGSAADWESLWATLSFERLPAPRGAGNRP